MIAGVLTQEDWDQIDQIAATKIREDDISLANGYYFGGVVVEYRSVFYWIADDFESREVLPAFIRSQTDALTYFQKCEHWYQRGHAEGIENAKRELRAWLND